MHLTRSAGGARRRFTLAALSLLTLSLLAVLAACGGDDGNSGDAAATQAAGNVGRTINVVGGSFIRVTPPELQRMLENKDFPLINVHIPYEGEIEGTDSHIAYTEILQRLSELPPDKNAKVVIYCRSGNMSTQAAQDLIKAGYTNVYELGGGMIAWEGAGLPIVNRG